MIDNGTYFKDFVKEIEDQEASQDRLKAFYVSKNEKPKRKRNLKKYSDDTPVYQFFPDPPSVLDWNLLRTFYYVAKAGSFTGAVRYLNITQPGISRIIQNLEKQLGDKLMVRAGSGKLCLTRAGEMTLDAVSQTFDPIESLSARIKENQQDTRGDVRLQASSEFIHLYLMKYIPGFLKQYPNIRLCLNSSKIIPELELSDTDIVIRAPFPDRPNLKQIPLITSPVKLYASAAYLEEFGTPQQPEDLNDHRLLGYRKSYREESLMNWHLGLGTSTGQERPAFLEADLTESRLALAAQGWGITAACASHPGLKTYDLVDVLPELVGPTVQYNYIYSTTYHTSKRIQLLGEYLETCFKQD